MQSSLVSVKGNLSAGTDNSHYIDWMGKEEGGGGIFPIIGTN